MKIANITFYIAVVLALTFIVFQDNIQNFFKDDTEVPELSDFTFADAFEKPYNLPEGQQGYIIFYGFPNDKLVCPACLSKLGYFEKISQSNPDIAMAAVTPYRKHFQEFIQLMGEFNMPGEYLTDDQLEFAQHFQLSENPTALLFTRDQKLLAALPLNVDIKGLYRQLQFYIAEM